MPYRNPAPPFNEMLGAGFYYGMFFVIQTTRLCKTKTMRLRMGRGKG